MVNFYSKISNIYQPTVLLVVVIAAIFKEVIYIILHFIHISYLIEVFSN